MMGGHGGRAAAPGSADQDGRADSAHTQPGRTVGDLGVRRRCVPHRQRRLLHRHRRPLGPTGGAGPLDRRADEVRDVSAARQARRPDRVQAAVAADERGRGGAVRRLAAAHGLVAVRRDDGRDGCRRGRPAVGPRRLQPGGVPAGGAGALAGLPRAARNVGYTLGALAAGLALATNSDDVVRSVPLVTATLLAVNAVWVFRLPNLAQTRDQRAHHDSPMEQAMGHAAEKRSALHNRGFFLMSVCNGVLGTHQVLLNVVIPLWLVQETDAPRVLLAWLFGTNTVMAVFLQVAAARGVTDVRRSLRAQYRGAACFVLSCAIVLVTHDTVGWVTIALVWIGHVTVTGAELFQSAGMWGLVSELSDPDRLGEYQGVSGLGYTLGDVWAPALYTFLAMTWGAPGWILIATVVVAAAVGIGPSSRAAERYLEPSRAAGRAL